MATRRSELTRQAARLFAEKGYHGTSVGDLAEAMGVKKASLYAHIEAKARLAFVVIRPMACETLVGQDRPHIAVELDASGRRSCEDEE